MKNVFIDTNIYLDFFRRTDAPISHISKLLDLIKRKEIYLIVTEQIIDEFYREVEVVKHTTIKKLESYNLVDKKLEVPNILKNVLNEDVLKSRKIFQNKINKAVKNYKEKVNNKRSMINSKINNILNTKHSTKTSEDILSKAYYRTLRGNPPRKDNNSYGDAINWETLLHAHSDHDLYIVSRDGDYASDVKDARINEFLEKEWIDKTKKSISLFTTLGEFLNEITGKKLVSKKEIELEREKPYNLGTPTFTELLGGALNPALTTASVGLTQPYHVFGGQAQPTLSGIYDSMHSASPPAFCPNCNIEFGAYERHFLTNECPYCGYNYNNGYPSA